MAKSVKLSDIAQKVGVSNVAVSKALSGKQGVSEELRYKIKNIAEEMGYISNTAKKGVIKETGNIGIITPEYFYGTATSFYGNLYKKVVEALYNNKYYGIMELLTAEAEESEELPKVVKDAKVDGLIFLGQMKESYVKKIEEEVKLPTFFLDTYIPFLDIDTVISDGYYGMYQLTNYLIKMGHKNIGYVGNVDATSSIADRYWGYRRSLRENNIEFKPEWEIKDRGEDGKTFDVILNKHKGIDAYVCNSDYVARIVIKNLKGLDCLVPEDVSVVGFDNFLPMDIDNPEITTYEVDVERMAEVCVKSLIKKIKQKRYVKGIQIITGKVIEKSTVKKLK